jgi:hypothetical protein
LAVGGLSRLRRGCASTSTKKLLYEFLRIDHDFPAS